MGKLKKYCGICKKQIYATYVFVTIGNKVYAAHIKCKKHYGGISNGK